MYRVGILQLVTLITSAIFCGLLIGNKLHGQNSYDRARLDANERQVTELSIIVPMLKLEVQNLNTRVDAVKSQSDQTQYIAMGFGISITFLQILGFIPKRERPKGE